MDLRLPRSLGRSMRHKGVSNPFPHRKRESQTLVPTAKGETPVDPQIPLIMDVTNKNAENWPQWRHRMWDYPSSAILPVSGQAQARAFFHAVNLVTLLVCYIATREPLKHRLKLPGKTTRVSLCQKVNVRLWARNHRTP